MEFLSQLISFFIAFYKVWLVKKDVCMFVSFMSCYGSLVF